MPCVRGRNSTHKKGNDAKRKPEIQMPKMWESVYARTEREGKQRRREEFGNKILLRGKQRSEYRAVFWDEQGKRGKVDKRAGGEDSRAREANSGKHHRTSGSDRIGRDVSYYQKRNDRNESKQRKTP